MRLYKQEEMLFKVTHQLANIELPLKQKTLMEMVEIAEKDKVHRRVVALTNLTLVKGKKLYQYFKQWQDYTVEADTLLNFDIKSKLIHRYKWILA